MAEKEEQAAEKTIEIQHREIVEAFMSVCRLVPGGLQTRGEIVSSVETGVYGPQAMLMNEFGPDFVKLDLQATTQDAAILEVAELLQLHPDMLDFGRFCEALLEREKLSSTVAGDAVAFPHARTKAVRNILVSMGRSKEGVPFGPDGIPVHFVVVIGVPKSMVREYLGVVGRLARLFREEGIRADLLEARNAGEFTSCLR